MVRCLYCNAAPNSEEHPLPAGLGKFVGGPTLLGRLCKACNNGPVGILDEQLLHAGPAAVLRRRFSVEGRKRKKKINPFYRGSAGAPPVEVKSWDENFGSDVLLEPLEGQHAEHLVQMIVEDQTGRQIFIPLTTSTAAADIRRRIQEMQPEGNINVRLIWAPDREAWAVDLFRELWPGREIPEPRAGANLFRGAVAKFQTTDRYYRAIAKMAFHYFLTQFPYYSGHEPIIDDIRAFIVNDSQAAVDNTLINDFINVYSAPLVPSLGHRLGHLICAEIRDNVCYGHVELFVSTGSRMPAFRVRLGALTEHTYGKRHATFFEYYPTQREGKYSGEAKAFSAASLNLEELPIWHLGTAFPLSARGIRMFAQSKLVDLASESLRRRFRQ